MTIGDYMETGDANDIRKAKDEFVDFIVGLEETLDDAEAYGKEGNIEMLTVLAELNTVTEDIAYYARRANEPVPMRNYHVEIGKLIVGHLPAILAREMDGIEKDIAEDPAYAADAMFRANQLENIINFYRELYPELNLVFWEERLQTVRIKISEISS